MTLRRQDRRCIALSLCYSQWTITMGKEVRFQTEKKMSTPMQENGLKQLILMSLALSTWYTFNAFSRQHLGNFSQLMYLLPILFTGYGIFCFWRQHRWPTVEVLFGVFLPLGMVLSFIPETWSTQPV
ncbi:MAG: hypothetical protein D6694_11080 [Gammaproteobacteria bacterium]|nr:MAG: hypothetical protein D6694_11080 [Gammaproteobacteria bacterium]